MIGRLHCAKMYFLKLFEWLLSDMVSLYFSAWICSETGRVLTNNGFGVTCDEVNYLVLTEQPEL